MAASNSSRGASFQTQMPFLSVLWFAWSNSTGRGWPRHFCKKMRAFGTGLPCSFRTRIRTVPPTFIRKSTGPMLEVIFTSFMSIACPPAVTMIQVAVGATPATHNCRSRRFSSSEHQ